MILGPALCLAVVTHSVTNHPHPSLTDDASNASGEVQTRDRQRGSRIWAVVVLWTDDPSVWTLSCDSIPPADIDVGVDTNFT